jgi:hypothetical protein
MAQLLLTGSTLTSGSNLDQALQLVESRLGAWSSRSNTDAYNALLLEVFGVQRSDATGALQAALSGSGLGISLEILDGATLNGINGAYTSAAPAGAERIYINAAWLQNATATAIEAVLLEELGHAIDHTLNGAADSPGDEGEIFSARLRGETPASSAFTEDDQRLIIRDGTTLSLEASVTTAPKGSQTLPAYASAITNPFGINGISMPSGLPSAGPRPAFADADADGDLDLFVGAQDGNIHYFKNNASSGATAPAFASPATNPFGISDVGGFASPTFADADGDGDLDLFVGAQHGNTILFLNKAGPNKTFSFAAATSNPYGIGDFGTSASPAFADADADGDLDFFVADQYGDIKFFRNTAASGATVPAYVAGGSNPFGIIGNDSYGKADYNSSPVFADVDTDGDLDLFVGNKYGFTIFYRNTATFVVNPSAYAAAITNPFGISNVGFTAKPAFADADRDGDLDLFIGNSVGNTLFFRNTAAAGATAPAYAVATTNPFGITHVGTSASTAFADADGDGDLDAFFGNLDGNTLFFRNTAAAGATAPAYAAATTNAFGITDVGLIANPAFADVDVDGDLDLFIGNSVGNTLFFRNTAAAGATAPAYAVATTNPFGITDVGYRARPAFADADADGDLDAFIGNYDGNTLFFSNTAAAGATAPAYAAATTNAFGITDVGFSASPAFADADRDGDLDLFIGNNAGNILLFRNTAVSGATAPAYSRYGENPFGITTVAPAVAATWYPNSTPALMDADRDGDLDLFIGNRLGNILFFRNTATEAVAPVASITPKGTYGSGATITLSVTFDVPVYVSIRNGTPSLQLETGNIDRYAFYSGGSGSKRLIFTYIVQNGDSSSDLTQLSASALQLNGGTIKGLDGTNAILTLAAPNSIGSLDSNAALVIDTTAPSAPTLALASDTGSSTSDGITNNASVQVSGLESGASWQFSLNGGSSWGTGSGSSFVLPDVTYAAGTILAFQRDAAGNTSPNGQLMLPVTVDTSAPAVQSDPAAATATTNPFGVTDVGISASPAFADADRDGDLDLFIGNNAGNILFFRNTAVSGATAPAYAAATTNPFGITDVGISASPAFADADGDGDLDLFIGNSVGNTLFFRNTAVSGATAPAYAAATTNPFGISVVGAHANPAVADVDGDGDLDLFIGNYDGNIKFFKNTAPLLGVSSATPNGSYGRGAAITLNVTFSEPVVVSTTAGVPALQLETGATDRYAVYTGGSGTNTLTFTYIVQSGDFSADLTQLSANALQLNGGTIKDVAGNSPISLSLPAPAAVGSLGSKAALVIDTTPPTGTLGSYATTPAFAAAATNPFAISDVGYSSSPAFADADADGDLDLFIGNYDGNTLFFRNTAALGATSPAYAAAATNPFRISDVGIGASPAFADADRDGDLDLFIGNSDGNTLFFRNDATLGATAPAYAAASTTNPFGISDVGNDASPAFADADGDGDLDLFIGNSVGNTLFFKNTALGATPPAYAAASTNRFGITDVGIDASPAFADADGDGDLDLFIGNSDGNTLFFRNTAAAGATNPAYSAATTNPFGITDVGDRARLAFADADADGDLDFFVGNGIDGNTLFFRNIATTPVAPVSSTTPNGSYGSGTAITLNVAFSEPVVVSTTAGIPSLQLETGATDRYADYTSGSGTNTLSFTYIVQFGDLSADLTQLSANALQLNGGTIKDAAGNNAILTLAAPDATGSLSVNSNLVITGAAMQVTSAVRVPVPSGGNGNVNAGEMITIMVNTREAVTVSGGTPSLTLNTGDIATYVEGSGTTSLVFKYILSPGRPSKGLVISAINSNGAILGNSAGNRLLNLSVHPGGIQVADISPTTTAAITGLHDNVGLIQGELANAAVTDDTTPTISGTISAALATDEILRIFNGTTLLGSATVNNTAKTWSFTSTALPNSPSTTYAITARVADASGNLGTVSATHSFTLDTTAPSTTAAITSVADNVGLIQEDTLAASGLTDDNTPTLSGSISATLAEGENLRIFNGATLLGNAIVNNEAFTWSFTPATALANGFYAISSRIADAAGNLAPASTVQRFSIDSTANQIIGDAKANLLTATAAKDVLTGLGGVDTFKITSLTSSTLANFDRITDFAIGTDFLDAPTPVSAANINKLGTVSELSSTSISTVLTSASFLANRAATFRYADPTGIFRSFIALNDGTAGYQSSTDAIIEITGYIRSLDSLQVI